ncbi:MAG: MerR family transcriptional regulator [Caloramator sp.]|nr:MerR family transcriptional regulator [Caloramator sp.]
MYIKEVCKECKLTKKAIEYYEQQGLIAPIIEDNGYRNYTDDDILFLKEVGSLKN